MSEQDYRELHEKMADLLKETNLLSRTHEALLIENSKMILVADKFIKCQRNMETLNRGEKYKKVVLNSYDDDENE